MDKPVRIMARSKPARRSYSPIGQQQISYIVDMPRIVLIDDDELVLDTVSGLMEAKGFVVEATQSGREGLRLCERQLPDLVITDIIMPDCEGIEMIRALRKSQGDVKILAISGGGRLGKDEVLALAGLMGADRVMAKPFAPEDLFQIVEQMLT